MSDNNKKCLRSGCSGELKKNGYRENKEGKVRRYKCSVCGDRPCETSLETQVDSGLDRKSISERRKKLNKDKQGSPVRRYVITAAQNSTPVHSKFFAALKTYCDHNSAELIVIPYRYTNPTSIWSKTANSNDWWSPDVLPYLLDERIFLNHNLMLLADIKVRPTAVSPLSGFDSITGGKSGIIGHPRLELSTIPTPQNKLPKIMTTTGTATIRNYTDSKAGKKAEFHHTLAATVVECDGPLFFMRQVIADDSGEFVDLDKHYSPDAVKPAGRALALITGDSHVANIDPDVVEATYEGEDSIVEALKPRRLVFHDLLDFMSRNHHDTKNFFRNYFKYRQGLDDVEAEVKTTLEFVDKVLPKRTEAIVVSSNHDEAFVRWLNESDMKRDVRNAKFYADTMSGILRDDGTIINPLKYWAKKWMRSHKKTRFLGRDESYRVKDIELAYHGDMGPHGSRGSRRSFDRIGTKTVIGHTHHPGIFGGVFQVGTSSQMDLDYNKGTPSGWLHCHCVIYPTGKRSLLICIDGRWRA